MSPADVRTLWFELRRAARTLTKNSADAEDAVQLAFLRALERRELWRMDTNWRGWLHAVVRRVIIDAARRNQRRRVAADVDLAALPAVAAEPRPRYDQVSPEDLKRAVVDCEQTFREIYQLYYEQDLSYAEIASRMQLPISTVSTRLYRARIRIRRHLEEHFKRGDHRKLRRLSYGHRPRAHLHPLTLGDLHVLHGYHSPAALFRSARDPSVRNLREQSAAPAFFPGQQLASRTRTSKGMTMKIKKIEQTKETNPQVKETKEHAGVQVKTDIKAGAARLVAVCG